MSIAPTVIVAKVMSTNTPGSGLESLLEPINYGSVQVNHYWWTVNLSILSFSVLSTTAFTTVFFVTHCLILADELRSLFHMIADHLDTGRIWDIVKVRNPLFSPSLGQASIRSLEKSLFCLL
jgi:hypothetical protein